MSGVTDDSEKNADRRWPAEWEPHAATWLAYPHNRETWPGKFERIPDRFDSLVRAIAEQEPVRLLAAPSNLDVETLRRLERLENVQLVPIPTNDAWIRDYGPTFIQPRAEQPCAVVWQYNAWGGKYPPFDLDNAAGQRVAETANAIYESSPLILEGGALESNGAGDLLTTACLLDPRRNPEVAADAVEAELRNRLAVQRVFWLPHTRLEGDDTDGHIDQLARFVDSTTMVAATADPSDAAHRHLADNRRFLESCGEGRFTVVDLPLPPPRFFKEHRLPASYCNFYLCNGAVIVPQFGDQRADEYAASVLGELLPSRRVIPLDALDLVWGLGAFHCLTQPQF